MHSSCAVLCHLVPSCAVLCHLVPSCAILCRLVPLCATLCFLVSSRTRRRADKQGRQRRTTRGNSTAGARRTRRNQGHSVYNCLKCLVPLKFWSLVPGSRREGLCQLLCRMPERISCARGGGVLLCRGRGRGTRRHKPPISSERPYNNLIIHRAYPI